MINLSLLLTSITLTSSVLSNAIPPLCGPDLIVDDFSQPRYSHDGRTINMVGGEIGKDEQTVSTVDRQSKSLHVRPGTTGNSYFFTRFVSPFCINTYTHDQTSNT